MPSWVFPWVISGQGKKHHQYPFTLDLVSSLGTLMCVPLEQKNQYEKLLVSEFMLLVLGWGGITCPLLLVGLSYFFLTSRCNNSGWWTQSFFSHFLLQQCWMRDFGKQEGLPARSGQVQKLIVSTQEALHRPCRPLTMGTLSISVMPMACSIKLEFSSVSNVYGHITLKAPVLVRSLKLSNVESCQYLDG